MAAGPGRLAGETAGTGTGAGRGVSPLPSTRFTGGLIFKLVALAFVNALTLWGIQQMVSDDKLTWAIIAGAALVLLDLIYLRQRRFIPGKYLFPGTLFLLIFALYPVGYTVYISFTNYGTGNNLSKEQAIRLIEANSVAASGTGDRYKLQVLAKGDVNGELAFLLTSPDGKVYLGTPDGVTQLPADQLVDQGTRKTVEGYVALNAGQANARRDDIAAFRVPSEAGEIQNEGFGAAFVKQQRLKYDPATNTMVDTVDGTVYTEENGTFVSSAGTALEPGWRTTIGTSNYKKIFTDPRYREAFARTFGWTFVFSLVSVATTFALGLLLAMVFNNERMKGRRLYRSLIIIPYALPSFMTALVWKGMLNTQFGIINRMFGWSIPWLDGTIGINAIWPYVSILLVNLWLGFPYMFLVTTGALQSIPTDLKEAAFVDGATGFKAFRRVTFPLLLVAVAPLLIASFAFNFNNFNLIYLLTEGKPPVLGSEIGRTDILISAAWKIAFGGGRGADYGLAAAISVIIFILVAVISAIGFRFTRSFEEVR